MKKIFAFLILFIFAAGCSSTHSLDDFQEEGEGITRSLVKELQKIETREQLLAASGELQRHFDRLAMIMIRAKEFQSAHPNLEKSPGPNYELSDQLRVELNRLYLLEDGRQIIEKSQEKAFAQI